MVSSVSKAYPEPIYLASRSPRRQELLKQIGVEFLLLDIEIDESVLAKEVPLSYVERMAVEKAQVGWQKVQPISLTQESCGVLAADTSVILDVDILGKPKSSEEAAYQLSRLSGRKHQVITSVALINKKGINQQTSITQVSFAELSSHQIEQYCVTGEGMDKAGGYAIQGLAAQFIQSINGSYTGVVGLPLFETACLLNEHFKVKT